MEDKSLDDGQVAVEGGPVQRCRAGGVGGGEEGRREDGEEVGDQVLGGGERNVGSGQLHDGAGKKTLRLEIM